MVDSKTAREMAEILQDSFGNKATLEAARRESAAREAGQEREAEDWREIRKLLSEWKSAPES